MNKLQKRLVSAAATATLLLNSLTPAFAATTFEITGNTNDGNNTTSVATSNTTAVTQSNNANVNNNISATANTGDNDANHNAGGDVSIDTGNATVTTTVENDLNHNSADVDGCGGCGFGDLEVEISGNTNYGDNTANVAGSQQTIVSQNNEADVDNNIYSSAKTGYNDTNRNAGGDVEVTTGNAEVTTEVTTVANTNSARIDGGEGGTVSARITGNTNDGDNDLGLALSASTWISQENDADVDNDIDSYAKTGDNDADHNAMGSVMIDTGNAKVSTEVVNALNSNSTLVEGGEGSSVDAVIAGNTNDGDNDILLALSALLSVAQENEGDLDNDIYAKADTGDNDANHNAGGEVEISTGNATVDIMVDNMMNFNVAEVECDCLFDDVLAKIAGNTNEDNSISGALDNQLIVDQANCGDEVHELSFWWDWNRDDCEIDNDLDANALTGDNEAEYNAGDHGSDPSVDTGDAEVEYDVNNSGNVNVYGDTDLDLPFLGEGVNVNVSFDLSDLLDWLSSHMS